MATNVTRSAPLILEETYVRQDTQGRYSLNDLLQAAGGESRHQPSNWLQNQQTKDLIGELENSWNSMSLGASTTGNPRSLEPAVSKVEGRNGGTYVARELVYAYAMWISPAFHLKVIRTFDALVSGGRALTTLADTLVNGVPYSAAVTLQNQSARLMTELERSSNRTLRRVKYEQLTHVMTALGQTTPPLEAIGADEPENPVAAVAFWAAYQVLQAAGVAVNHHRDPRLIAVNLRQLASAAAERGIRLSAQAALKDALRQSKTPRFHDVRSVNSVILGQTIHCWIFEAVTAQEGGAA